MKKFLTLSSVILMSSVVSADTINFKAKNIDSHTGMIGQPFLNLNGANSVNIVAGDSDDMVNGEFNIIESLEISFPNAKSFTAKNLKRTQYNEYSTTVEDAWLYRSVTTTVHFPEGLTDSSMFNISISVDLEESYTQGGSAPLSHETRLVDVFAQLERNQERVIADSISFEHQGKSLTLTVHKDLTVSSNRELKIDSSINWLGHGSADVSVFSQLPAEEAYNLKVISVRVEGADSTRPSIIYRLKDINGGEFELNEALEVLLREANL